MSQVFLSKQQKLDWQLIAEIEPMVVVMGAEEEIDKLKNVQSSLAFCSIENEFTKVKWLQQAQFLFNSFISRMYLKIQEDLPKSLDYRN